MAEVIDILVRNEESRKQILALAEEPQNAALIAKILRARKIIAYWHSKLKGGKDRLYVVYFRITALNKGIEIKAKKTEKYEIALDTHDTARCDLVIKIYGMMQRYPVQYHQIVTPRKEKSVYAFGCEKRKFYGWIPDQKDRFIARLMIADTESMSEDEFNESIAMIEKLQTVLASTEMRDKLSGKIIDSIPGLCYNQVEFKTTWDFNSDTRSWHFITTAPRCCFSSNNFSLMVVIKSGDYYSHVLSTPLTYKDLTDNHILGLRALKIVYDAILYWMI